MLESTTSAFYVDHILEKIPQSPFNFTRLRLQGLTKLRENGDYVALRQKSPMEDNINVWQYY